MNRLFTRAANAFILRAIRREPMAQHVTTSTGATNMHRYAPFWPDEQRGRNRPPWYRPFNILLHRWVNDVRERMHDHPRWSVTVVLRGEIIEHTPWGSRRLTPGSVVLRSRKAIHAFELPPGFKGRTWTMFVVGRRNHSQNYYTIDQMASSSNPRRTA